MINMSKTFTKQKIDVLKKAQQSLIKNTIYKKYLRYGYYWNRRLKQVCYSAQIEKNHK
jgi:hypothetical protein